MESLGAFWKAAVGVAGLASVVSFVLYSLYKQWLSLPIFSTLTKDQQFRLFRLFLILTFFFSLAGLAAYVATKLMDRPPSPSATASPGTPSSEPALAFVPIDEKAALIQSFAPVLDGPAGGPTVRMHFHAPKLKLDFDFDVPVDIKPYALLDQLIQHFALKEHVVLDLSKYPTGLKGGFWYSDWRLLLNGTEVGKEYLERDSKSLRQLGASRGDVVTVKVLWELGVTVSTRGSEPDGKKAKAPPNGEL